MGCGNKNKIFDLKQEKLSFYKKHLGEYEMFSYHHSSSSATAESFADSDFSFMDTKIYLKNDEIIYNGDSYPLNLFCPCELNENHPLFQKMCFIDDSRRHIDEGFYDYNYNSDDYFDFKYQDIVYPTWGELIEQFTNKNEIYYFKPIEKRERSVFGYSIIDEYDIQHNHNEELFSTEIYELYAKIDDTTYICLDGSLPHLLFDIKTVNDEIYEYTQEWIYEEPAFYDRVKIRLEDAYTFDYKWTIRDGRNYCRYDDSTIVIDDDSRKPVQYYTCFEAFCYSIAIDDDNTDDDSQHDDENNGTEEIPLDFSITGDWSYSIQGFQPTTLTLYNDQTFEFNKNNDITSGTYSLSGNKITFDFEKGGQEITDMFIISGSENEITLNLVKSITTYDGSTQESTTMSYMLLAFYTTMETSITLTK